MISYASGTSTAAPAAIELSADDPINIQYTSGTTGFPKGATPSHHNILNNGYFVGELSSLRTGIMAGSPCPAEIMEQVIDRMGCASSARASSPTTRSRATCTWSRSSR